MTGFSKRSEQIAAHLLGHETGAVVVPFDTDGRHNAVDFILEWRDGRRGALEVTLVTETASIAWQGMAAKDGWRWPAETSWEFRPTQVSFPYKFTRRVVLSAVELCDKWSVDDPSDLPAEVLTTAPEITKFLSDNVGKLRRTPFRSGIVLYQNTRAEFVDAAPRDFSSVVEAWHHQPHLAPHLEKLMKTDHVSERHLFLVPMDDVLPARFFTDDFDAPASVPRGFEGVDALWIWSNYWHRYLVLRDRTWSWVELPHE